jgi:hypothetical protein
MQDVDWGDFVVVGKIDLYDDEEMKMLEESESGGVSEVALQSKNLIAKIEENELFIAMPEVLPPQVEVIATALDPEMKVKKNY